MPDEVLSEPHENGESAVEDAKVNPSLEPVLPAMLSVGCSDLPPRLRRQRYFQRLRYLETEVTRFDVPKAKILKQWAAEAGEHGRFGLLAPQEITDRPGRKGYARTRQTYSAEELAQAGGFRATELVERAVQSIVDACATARADVVIFRSPPDFTPSSSNRERLRTFFNEIAPQSRFGATARVWEPQGLWEIRPAARLAAELDLVLACDPLSNDPLSEAEVHFATLPVSRVYFRVTGMGRDNQRFDDYALEPLIDMVQSYEHAWIVFAHTHKYPDAIRCQRLLASVLATPLDDPD